MGGRIMKIELSMTKNLCGIDEAGRGPFAGPMVVAGVLLHKEIKELNDSKKLSEKKREILYEKIILNAAYHIVKFSAQDIDKNGISYCLKNGLKSIMSHLNADEYLFDGNSSFGVKNLSTMIKADAKIPEVSAASILAKVTHDRDILKQALLYPEYQFEKHKGYGTKLHIEMIKKYGYSPLHRKTFKIKQLEATLMDFMR